ncbi:MAG: NAD(P)/FAD-dependent oxidoreductase [Gammaproteobacteria bacterium]
MTDVVDCIVVGAGVVGLAVAARLAAEGVEVVVLERHGLIGSETSSRNSEVIHAGIYYPTGSAKARLCVRGKQLLYEHCAKYAVPFRRCGKVIVATSEAQRPVVDGYIEQARRNGVTDLSWIDRGQLHELEPEVLGVGAALSPSTGIIDSHAYMLSLQGMLEANGGLLALNSPVTQIEAGPTLMVHTPQMSLGARWVINAGGLSAPELAANVPGAPQAYYAIGHYYTYSGAQPFGRLVYPTAQDGGLGVHVTLDLGGQVKFGPDVRWIDSVDYTFDDSRRPEFVEAIKAYYPGLDEERLQPGYTGVRPKIAPAGVAADFVIQTPADHGVAGRINLLGIESPGLTSSLAIAEAVSEITGYSAGKVGTLG